MREVDGQRNHTGDTQITMNSITLGLIMVTIVGRMKTTIEIPIQHNRTHTGHHIKSNIPDIIQKIDLLPGTIHREILLTHQGDMRRMIETESSTDVKVFLSTGTTLLREEGLGKAHILGIDHFHQKETESPIPGTNIAKSTQTQILMTIRIVLTQI